MSLPSCHALAMGAFCALGVVSVLPSSVAATETGRDHRIPEQLFAGESRGPWQTGTFEEMWVNESMDDPSTAATGDPRRLVVQVWYPATLPRNPRYAPYAISPQLYGRDHWVHELEHVRTQSVLNAPMAAGSGRLPVLIYNHGAGNPHFSGTSQTEFLASHGYVVVSIGHTSENDMERFPDGTPYRNDGTRYWLDAPPGEAQSKRDAAEYEWAHGDLGLFVKDISFVLDRLAALDADPGHRFHRRLDLDRVGSLGWSFGGYLSLQAGRDEPRIKAVANLDGLNLLGLMGPHGVATLGSERPMLLMFADRRDEESPPYPGAEFDADRTEEMEVTWALHAHYWTMLRRSTADWYYVTVARTHHAYFSDRILFSERDTTGLHPRAAHAVVNGYLLAFFDEYLRGGDVDTPLLSGKRGFPEATLWRKRSAGVTGVPRKAAGAQAMAPGM